MIYPSVLKKGCTTWLVLSMAVSLAMARILVGADLPVAVPDSSGALAYHRDSLGNRIPDFSHCGFAGANEEIPEVPVRLVVEPDTGEDGSQIQEAIDRLAQLPIDPNGFRGCILLAPGRFEIAGQLHISASGIVIRGCGASEDGTTLVAVGTDRRALIRIEGSADRRTRDAKPRRVTDHYVPVGARQLQLDTTAGLKGGDQILIRRPSTIEWIKTIGTDAFGVAWRPGTRDILWDRTIVGIDNQSVTLDAPLTTAIEQGFGGATVEVYDWPGRVANVGIEDLRLLSEYVADRPHDEDHAWFGVTMNHVNNAWVRRVEFRHFAGGAVALWENTKHITVEDCISLEPISERAGYRRHTFFTQGQLTLFLRCWSSRGRHDFAVGHCAPGPNAFVNCYADNAHASSGPIESWASGVLYDNVRIDGAGLELDNRWAIPPGTGWSAANCVLWQCQAAAIRVFSPPTAHNWAIGAWGQFAGDGTIDAHNDFVRPISLYQAQLRERCGKQRADSVGLGLANPISSTNPTLSEAADFTDQSKHPSRKLIDIIRERCQAQTPRYNLQLQPARVNPLPVSPRTKSGTTDDGTSSDIQKKRLVIQNGWLVVDGSLKTGGLLQQGFWRGTIRPAEAPQFGPAITRFVPGRVGNGFTDDLAQLAHHMLVNRLAVFDHHYGLWYDRRRDDHTMVRRQDGNVVPPFYEQPFARSGRGKAWDGLSKYDLTRFNPWYWQRLRQFAQLCDRHGLVLFHQGYFQHNILEAGAHWADCPWRAANNINDTGLPEPPPYIGDKRIFMAARFYDVTNPRLSDLHRGYIRHCLDQLADCSNVIHMTSAEYSGPVEFLQFWLDTIVQWKRQRGSNVLVALSAPKNVQDAILSDSRRAPHVDVIDIRYWAYTADGSLYAPDGGKNLAPRQHLRQTKQKPGGFHAIVKAVREYRTRYPGKAITYYADMHCPSGRDSWAVLIGGGSLPNINLPDELTRKIPSMSPADNLVTSGRAWCLASDRGDCLVYAEHLGETLQLSLPDSASDYRGYWIDVNTNTVSSADLTDVESPFSIRAETNVLWLKRIPSEE